MSEENNNNEGEGVADNSGSAKDKAAAAGQGLQNAVGFFKENPKALYALGGAVVIGALAMLMGGDEDGQLHVNTQVSMGQTITLENPNGGLSHLTVKPGLMSTTDAEEDKDASVCVVQPGTQAKVEEEQLAASTFGTLPYVKVTVTSGDCQGKTGWTSKINVKQ